MKDQTAEQTGVAAQVEEQQVAATEPAMPESAPRNNHSVESSGKSSDGKKEQALPKTKAQAADANSNDSGREAPAQAPAQTAGAQSAKARSSRSSNDEPSPEQTKASTPTQENSDRKSQDLRASLLDIDDSFNGAGVKQHNPKTEQNVTIKATQESNTTTETPLTQMVKENHNSSKLEGLLRAGNDIDGKNSDGDTALIVAIAEDKLGIALALLDKKANPSITNANGETALKLLESNYEETEPKPPKYYELLAKLQQAPQQRTSFWSFLGLGNYSSQQRASSPSENSTTSSPRGDFDSGGGYGGGGNKGTVEQPYDPLVENEEAQRPTLFSLGKVVYERIFGSTPAHEDSISQQVSAALTVSGANSSGNEPSAPHPQASPAVPGERKEHMKHHSLSPAGERENKHKAAKTSSTSQEHPPRKESEGAEVVLDAGMTASGSDLFTAHDKEEKNDENMPPNQVPLHHQESQPSMAERLAVEASHTAAIETPPHSENAQTHNTQASQQVRQRPLATKTSSRTSFAHTTPEHRTFAAVVKANQDLAGCFDDLLASCAAGAEEFHENKWHNTKGKLQLNQGEALGRDQEEIIDSLVAASVYKFQLEPITIRGGTEAQQIAAITSALDRGFTDITVVEVKEQSPKYKNLIAETKAMKRFRGHKDILEAIRDNNVKKPISIFDNKIIDFRQNKATTPRVPLTEIQPNSGPSGMH